MPSCGSLVLGLSLCIVAPAVGQQLSRLVDTTPGSYGNAWIVHRGPTRTWLTGGGWLWRTDGTPAGTQTFHSLAGAEVSSCVEIADHVFIAPRLNYVGQGLIKLDPAGTPTRLMPIGANISYLHELHGQLLFRETVTTGIYPNWIYVTRSWLSDGTPAGTRLAPHIPVDTSNPADPWRLHGDLLFPIDGTYVSTLYITDGPTTTALTSVNLGIGSGQGFGAVAFSTGRQLFFIKRIPGAVANQVSLELWKTDGTVAGTVRVYDPAQAGYPPLWDVLGCIGDRVYFAGGASLCELWQSDGTPAGTTYVTLLPGVPSRHYHLATAAGGIYFMANDATGLKGVEPMFTDGTAAGSYFLGDLTPGPNSSVSVTAMHIGGNTVWMRGLFAGRYEVWSSNGTPASTTFRLDLSTALAANPTSPHALVGGRYVFVGTDPLGDREIWSVGGAAVTAPIGEGHPSRTAPRLWGTRAILGTTATIGLDRAQPSTGGVLVAGSSPAWVTLHAGVVPLYVDLSQPLIVAGLVTDAAGLWSAAVPVPNAASLIGATLAFQAAIGPTPAPVVGLDVSNGLSVTLGN